MIRTNALKGAIYASGHTMAEAAGMLGISRQTFHRKMSDGGFTITEVDSLIRWAYITHPEEVFPFAVAGKE